LDPKYADPWIEKGIIFYLQDKNYEALQALDKAIELDPKNEKAWGYKSLVLTYLGKREEALEASNMTEPGWLLAD
jgi:superkiller protein 3